jgi:hypothetical protein
MPRQNLEITGINGVGAGSIASVDLTVGRRYHDFLLRVSCTAKPSPTWAEMHAMIRKITLLANSRPIREFTVAELEEVLRFNKMARPVGRLPIYFSEPWRVTRAEEEFYALKADRLSTLQLKVEFATDAQAGFSLAGLSLTGLQSFDYVRAEHGSFVHWTRVSPPLTSAGVGYWKDLERVGAYSRIHILSSDVTRVKVKVGSDEIFDKTKSDNELLAAAYDFDASSANTYNIAFDYTGYNSDSLVMTKEVAPNVFAPVESFEIEVTRTAGGGNLPALVEQIKTLG